MFSLGEADKSRLLRWKRRDPIQPGPYSNSMSLQDCKAACTADYNCQGVIRKTSDGQGSGVCYKRRNIVTSHCVRDPVWELHRKPTSGGDIPSIDQFESMTSFKDLPQQPQGLPVKPTAADMVFRAIHATYLTLTSTPNYAQPTTI